jgi:predicted nuclease with RNAse H fold
MLSLGIDVSIARGLDLVWLNEDRCIVASHHHVTLADLPDLLALSPKIIAIDSPPAWAPETGRRRTETEIWRLGFQLFPTPALSRRSLKGADAWMEVGMSVFAAVAALGFPLFDGQSFASTAIEVFPHAAADVLAGSLPPFGADLKHPRAKAVWRAGVLAREGTAVAERSTLDQIDAALAALTGLYALEGRACWRGNPAEGVIVLPCRPDALAAPYLRQEQYL